ncbi:chemotaxis protein [Luteimonas sp. BDR2-5]|uniref:chemotaxis protein CheB n=1 Tax=Proluteimonas luteida TaxID=2878685 RepID=UPI001E45016C|nr:chemotaxis protein CheB [Luteimonas sp. BDR2-5]MCD9028885.1 chemotaxis protein [Luteimonas sp. BDR2-5]
MSDRPIRTAVLAREGAARDRIVEGLQATGVEVVGVLDPVVAEPQALVALAPTAIIVSLEPVLEDALERYVEAFGDPAVTVIFEEASLVLDRTGWDAARWLRHLSAKLRRDVDVLPPGPQHDDDLAGPEIGIDAAELALALDDGAATAAPDDAGAGNVGFNAFDPVAFEHGTDTAVELSIVVDPALAAGLELAARDDDAPTDAADVAGVDDDIAGWSVEMPVEVSEPASPADAADAAPAFDDDPRADAPGIATEQPTAGPVSDVDALPSFAAAATTAHAPDVAPNAPARVDLAALETRISGLSLADTDSYGHGPEHGAVLVEGGLGGPDAVRQLLAAIPPGFPRPILVRLHLDGGRYDRLVRQMERAAQLPVSLAEAGNGIADGEIHFVTPDLDIARRDGVLRFVEAGGTSALPAALPADDSAVLFLSGSDVALVEQAMGPAWQGALVAGQSPEGCYDATAASAAIARGSASGTPAELAAILAARWIPAAHALSLDTGDLSP